MPKARIANRARVVRAGSSPRKPAGISWKTRTIWFRHPLRFLQLKLRQSKFGGGTRRTYTPQTEEAKRQLRNRK